MQLSDILADEVTHRRGTECERSPHLFNQEEHYPALLTELQSTQLSIGRYRNLQELRNSKRCVLRFVVIPARA